MTGKQEPYSISYSSSQNYYDKGVVDSDDASSTGDDEDFIVPFIIGGASLLTLVLIFIIICCYKRCIAKRNGSTRVTNLRQNIRVNTVNASQRFPMRGAANGSDILGAS